MVFVSKGQTKPIMYVVINNVPMYMPDSTYIFNDSPKKIIIKFDLAERLELDTTISYIMKYNGEEIKIKSLKDFTYYKKQ